MKTKKSKTAGNASPKKTTSGRAAFIHKLKTDGVKMDKALELVKTKFRCTPGILKKVWERKGVA